MSVPQSNSRTVSQSVSHSGEAETILLSGSLALPRNLAVLGLEVLGGRLRPSGEVALVEAGDKDGRRGKRGSTITDKDSNK